MAKNDTLNTFIPLERTFHELLQNEAAGDEAELTPAGRRGELLWKDLLAAPRVILLSEAGAGKTAEIRNVCRRLRNDGLPAFFIRIEHVAQSFEDAFEEGSYGEFVAWTSGGKEGWLLLDSVDEARLRDPKDFELAVLKLARKLAPVLQQAHIVITGRATAWRPKTDLLLVKRAFSYELPLVTVADDTESEEIDDFGKFVLEKKPRDAFRIVALDDLHGEQVDRFVQGKGVADIEADVRMTATDLYDDFQHDETLANKKYLNKVIEVTGTVSEVQNVNGSQIILLDSGRDMGGISGQLANDKNNKADIKKSTIITVKGKCSGFLIDVNLVDCVLK